MFFSIPHFYVKMQSNPIIEQQQRDESERRAKTAFRYPFQIVYIYLDAENRDFPIFHEVKEYCSNNNLIFTARQYEFEKYPDDMYIKRLPAVHIYYKKGWQDTQHYDTDPIHKIQVLVWAYQDEELKKERRRIRRQEQWDSLKENFNSIFTLEHFKRKPKLDIDASLSMKRIEN
jgi:hypothetical protein